MFRDPKHSGRWLAIAVAVALACSSHALAVKPPKPPAGETPAYVLIDLLGFPDNGYQSSAMFISNRDAGGNVLIGGNSRRYPDPDGPAEFHPALWHVDSNGDFPPGDPVDLGTPACGGEVGPNGMNSFGVMVATTGLAVEKDDAGNWVFPSYVIVPGQPFRELPGLVSRNNSGQGINDLGEIIGRFEAPDGDPVSPGGVWQLELNGNIIGPTSLGQFEPRDVNNFGVIAGHFEGLPAIAWYNDGKLLIEQLDSSPRFWGAGVAALNNYPAGDTRLTVVGYFCRDEDGNPILPWNGYAWKPFDAGTPTLLGTLGGRDSVPLDVNGQGAIVGWSDTKRQGQQAFIFQDGKMSNLNSLADVGSNTLQHANAINDHGDIVGFMGIPRPVSELRGFLLKPIPKPPQE